MTNKVKIITAPDHILDREESLLVICPADDLKKQVEEYVMSDDRPLNVYLYTVDSNNIRWLLTTVNIADKIILDIDNCPADVSQFVSYILSFSNTYYRCQHQLAPWELLNLNRFYDFPNI